MEYANFLILVGAVLLAASIIVSALATRIGAPLLLVFLVIGMLAGEDGPGGINFNNFGLAYLIGNLCLAVILLDGGMRTRYARFRTALWPALSLATVRVMMTAAIIGAFASWLLGVHWLRGLLIGAIVGSTDAAAVFALLHAHGLKVKERVAATLEIESGSNDPMAVFMTVALIELLLAGRSAIAPGVAIAFVQQMGVGAVAGVAGGWLLPRVINRLNLAEGLYPLLATAGGLTVFGATMVSGGSGYLAIYLTGLMLGNHRLHSARNILRVHDGLAWLAQIAMFLMLGLLVTPSALLVEGWAALAIALVLIVIARPVAVGLCLLPFRWPWREKAFVAWVGLRGAVPIILAVFPVLAGLPAAETYFNIAFFVVLVSLVLQGWTIAPLARGLGLELPHDTEPARRIDVELPAGPDFELVTYTLTPDCIATGLRMAALPPAVRARLVGLFRGRQALRPDDATELERGDELVLLAPADEVETLNRWFTPHTSDERVAERQLFGDFTIQSGARLADLAAVYGLNLEPGQAELTAEQLIRQRFGGRPTVGDRVVLDRMELVVREIAGDRIVKVGLVFGLPALKTRKGRT